MTRDDASGAPAQLPHELRRERLLEVLHKHRAQPLIVLVAPAGFGKSTLAATYARDSGGAVIWLSLQVADRDTRRLFTRLAYELEIALDKPQGLLELRRGLRENAEGVGLARLLLTDLAQALPGFIIVLDDFHVLNDSEEVTDSIDALVRELPDSGQIVITSREPPRLSMTRLLAQGKVFALGTEDLRFSAEETAELRAILGGDSSRDALAEGWVAGILLGGAPGSLGVAGASVLGGFIETEILSRLTAEEQSWLESLSVFDTITAQTAEAVLGEGPWPSRLVALSERCPFFIRGQDGAYHLHALVRETVSYRLLRSPDRRAERAWTVSLRLSEQANDVAGVVRAAQELGRIEVAVDAVLREATEHIQRGRWPNVVNTLHLLPEAVRRGHPDVSLIEARALVNTGRAEDALKAARAALEHGGRSGDQRVQINALIELAAVSMVSSIAAAEDWLSAADQLLKDSRLPDETQWFLQGKALGIRGICAASAGDIARARDAFETGEHLLSRGGQRSRELALLRQNFGSFCNRIGEYARAQEALSAAASYWRVNGDSIGHATSLTILGDLLLRLGNLQAAGAALNEAHAAARSVGALRMEAWAIESLGQWHRANGRIIDAVAAFDESIKLSEQIVERELLTEALAYRAEIALLQDDLATAVELLSRAQSEAQQVGSNAALAIVDRALGRFHLMDGAKSRAIEHFKQALERAGDTWGPDQRAETLYWLGTAYLELNRPQLANQCLEQAVELVKTTKLPGLLAGPAAEAPRLLQTGRKLGVDPVVLGDVERLAATRRPYTGVRTEERLDVVAQNELPRLEVQLFGSFVLHCNGELLEKSSRKIDRAGELAALLILNPQGLSDEAIAEMMYPDMLHEKALHNVQMAAYSLRHDLSSKAAVRHGAHMYQLSPQLELIADVREFDSAIASARGSIGGALIQALTRAADLYKGPLLADAAWEWLDTVRLDYRTRYVSAALQLADALATVDTLRSDGVAEDVLAAAPETDLAYERLIHNAKSRDDASALRRLRTRYEQAAVRFGFTVNPYLIDDGGSRTRHAR